MSLDLVEGKVWTGARQNLQPPYLVFKRSNRAWSFTTSCPALALVVPMPFLKQFLAMCPFFPQIEQSRADWSLNLVFHSSKASGSDSHNLSTVDLRYPYRMVHSVVAELLGDQAVQLGQDRHVLSEVLFADVQPLQVARIYVL